MSFEIDHLIVCVTDLDAASTQAEDRFGLVSCEGGRHPGHGTANHLIPLGPNYIELATVVDEAEAASSSFGSWVAARARSSPFHVDGLALRTRRIEEDSARLGLSPVPMSRARPDGYLLKWRLAGLDGLTGPDNLPFVIQWDVPETEMPGRSPAGHRVPTGGIVTVILSGEPSKITPFSAGTPGIAVREGEPAVLDATLILDGNAVSWVGD